VLINSTLFQFATAAPLLAAKRDPQDLPGYLRSVVSEDRQVYDQCRLPAFHSRYFLLARKLGVPGRQELRMSRKTR
jgi:hypothetical protein